MAVLGISANSRVLGLAIVDNQRLVEYKTELRKNRWDEAKLHNILCSIKECIESFSVASLVLTIPRPHYLYPEAKHLLESIKEFCTELSLPMYTYDADTLYRLFTPGKATKQAIMKAMASLYPQLVHLQRREIHNKHKYYHKVFEAVCVATVHTRQFDKNNSN
jgi:hypothetical protein